MSTTTHSLTLDSTNGCSLHGVDEALLSVGHPQLQALDVINAPALERLVIEEQHPDECLHLRVDNAPALSRIELSADSPGLILHIASSGSLAGLVIEGPVAELDAACEDGPFALTPSNGQPWRTVRFARASEVEDLQHQGDFPEQGLAVITGECDTDPPISLNGRRDWAIQNATTPWLEFRGHGGLWVNGAHQLTSITCHNQGSVLELSDVAILRSIRGDGDRLRLRDDRGLLAGLFIEDAWESVSLRCPRLKRLGAVEVAHLRLLDCHQLSDVETGPHVRAECYGSMPAALADTATFVVDESTVREHIARIRAGDDSQLESLLQALGQLKRRTDVFNGLRLLQELTELGFDAQRLWHTRECLHASQLQRRRAGTLFTQEQLDRGSGEWHWRFPEGLEEEGWQADLHVWAYCQQYSPRARRYQRTLRRQGGEAYPLVALIQSGIRAQPGSALHEVMIETLNRYARSVRRWSPDASANRVGKKLAELVSTPSALARTDQAGREAMLDYFIRHYAYRTLAKELAQLLPRWPELVRPRLMLLANPKGTWLEGLYRAGQWGEPSERWSSTFLQMALMPTQPTTEET